MNSFYDETVIRLGLPPEQTTLPRIVFYYNEGVVFEGHKGLDSFSEDAVVCKIGKDKLKIEGEGLNVREISCDRIFVRGNISAIGVVHAK